MLQTASALSIVLVIALTAEYLWRKKLIHGEYARKFVHIALSIHIALFPLYLSWRQIWIIGAICIPVIVVCRLLGISKSVYEIDRKSWGDIIGPVAMLGCALLQPAAAVFSATVLYIGLADGLAAVVGTKFGQNNAYKVFGYKKSLVGSATFFIVALGITAMAFFALGVDGSNFILAIVLVPVLLTLVENISYYGVDNLLILLASLLSFMLLDVNLA